MCCNISAIHIWKGTVLARFAQDITANMDQSGEPTVVSAGGRQTQQAQRIRIGSGLRSAKMTHKNGKSYKVKFLNFFQLYFFNFWSSKPWIGNRSPDPDSLEMLDAGSGTESGSTTLVQRTKVL